MFINRKMDLIQLLERISPIFETLRHQLSKGRGRLAYVYPTFVLILDLRYRKSLFFALEVFHLNDNVVTFAFIVDLPFYVFYIKFLLF